MVIAVDASVLSAYYGARAGIGLASAGSRSTASAAKNPTPPWATSSTAPKMADLVKTVLRGSRFVDPGAAKLDAPGSSDDYRKLFGLYQGMVALEGLSEQIAAKGVSETEKARMRTRFAEGMKEVSAYLDTARFDQFAIAQGAVSNKLKAGVGVKRENDLYNTGVLHSGSATAEVAAFQGPVQFSLEVKKYSGATVNVGFDLAEMGTTPRTMSNVVLYLNDKLQAAGVATRFANVRTPGAPQTVQAGGQTITLGTGPDTYSLQIKGVGTETLTFSAAGAAAGVYLGGAMGGTSAAPGPQQLMKFSTDPAAGATTAADGKVYEKAAGREVKAVRASVAGADGSLYVLGDVDSATGGQSIKGSRDVVLNKYDSAGNIVWTRTLGAAQEAAGFALALSPDGTKVAIAGSVTGALDNGDAGVDAKVSDSFVGVFDTEGQAVWSTRRGGRGADQMTGVAFGADGAVYVTGKTDGSVQPGAAVVGGQDSFIMGFGLATGTNPPEAYTQKFAVQYGTAGTDTPAGIAVNGSTLVVAGTENGRAVLRRYDLQATGAPVLGATRDLGAIQGSLAGVGFAADGSVIVAGQTRNGALSAGAVTTAYTSGLSAFVAKLDGALNASGAERLTYYGGGDRTATAVTVAGGRAYVTGQIAVAPPPGQTAAFDGYAAAIDATTGAVAWSQQFRGADRNAAPTTIAVDTSGASVLDRLGLPRGAIDWTGSAEVVANSSARPGDQFYVKSGSGSARAVTIEAGDTLKTLAAKISRAIGFTAKVEVVVDKGYDKLQITPLYANQAIEIEAGKTGRDALSALGLSEGLVKLDASGARKEKKTYGLQLPSTLNLDTEGKAKQAQAMLLTALSTVRSIYREATNPVDETKGKTGGTVPAYLTAQISNYQEALRRLGG